MNSYNKAHHIHVSISYHIHKSEICHKNALIHMGSINVLSLKPFYSTEIPRGLCITRKLKLKEK